MKLTKDNTLKHNIVAKVVAFILAITATVILVACIIGAVAMCYFNMYTITKQDFMKQQFNTICQRDYQNLLSCMELHRNEGTPHLSNSITSVYVTDSDTNSVLFQWKNNREILEDTGLDFTFNKTIKDKGLIRGILGSTSYTGVNVVINYTIDTAVNDGYTLAYNVINLAYSMLYSVYALGAIALVIAIICFIFLMYSAGYRSGCNKATAGWGTKVPFDLLTVIVSILLFFICYSINMFFHQISYSVGSDSIIPLVIGTLIMGLCAVLSIILGWLMSLAVRIKLGSWWKNTVIYRMVMLFVKMLKFTGKKVMCFIKLFLKLCGNIPFVWKTSVILLIISVVNFIIINCVWYNLINLVIVWFLESIIIGVTVLYCAILFKRLQKYGEALAKGDITYHIDTTKMFGEFKMHGENLNSIAKGINYAVEQRTKSERMKTQLITNVSHDIKTPLTSIINYTDLITNEPCENPKVINYSKVLFRQSERLKKLIDDLIEASKASTGNIDVELSPCEANIFLTQATGEYQEQLKRKKLELVASQPSTSVMIMADGRRLWRVFDNLINNICKYAQENTRVYLSLEEANQQAIITLKNISASPLNITADELMERFVRGDDSRSTSGNGLGLSIAKSLTELQKGSLELSIDGDLFKVMLKFPVINN
ncbi:MAG: HAMP domain-containing sensor histidine kinase [Acutalibacteraceae bacterium]